MDNQHKVFPKLDTTVIDCLVLCGQAGFLSLGSFVYSEAGIEEDGFLDATILIAQ